MLLAPAFLPESRTSREAAQIDVVGTLLITTGLTALLLPLVEGRQQGFPAWTWLSLAAAPILLAGFVIHQLRLARHGGRPLLEPRLFQARSFSAGLLTQLVFWGGMASFFVVLALYLQEGRGLNALQAGLVFTILAAAYLVTSLRAPRLTLRYGRRLILIGALTLAAGYALLLLGVDLASGIDGPGWVILLAPGLALAGAGMGLCTTPLVATVLSSVQPEHAGAASGILSTVQQLGNALGVAVSGLIFFGALQSGQGGYSYAFQLALGEFVMLLVGVAALSRLLPRGAQA